MMSVTLFRYLICPRCCFLYCHHVGEYRLCCWQCSYKWNEQAV